MAFDPSSGISANLGGSASAALGAPPKSPLDDSDQRVKDFEGKQAELSAKADEIAKTTKAENAKLEDYFEKNRPPVYKPPAPYKPPEGDNAISSWGALAIAFAALASGFTRTPMTTALGAASAAMNAMKQQNMEAAKDHYQQWKDANAQALDLAKYQQEAYKELMSTVERRQKNNVDLAKEQTADIRAQIAAIASAFKDETMLKIGQDRGLEAQQKEYDRRDKEIEQLRQGQEKIDQGFAKMQTQVEEAKAEAAVVRTPEFQKAEPVDRLDMLAKANPTKYAAEAAKQTLAQEKFEESAGHQAAQQVKDWEAQHLGASPEDRLRATNQIYSAYKTSGGARLLPPLTDEQVPFQAREIGEYRMKVPSQTLMSRQPGWDKVVEQAEKDYPGFNPAKYDLVQKARAKLEAGKDSDAIASYTRLNQHLEFFQGLVDRLPNEADVNVLNKLAAAWGKQTGNANVTSFDTAAELVGDEVVKAVTGTGAAGALGDREAIKKNLDHSLGPEQLKANINAIKALVGGAIVSTREKYQSILPPEELNAVFPSPEVLEDYHIDPATGKVRIEGVYDFGGHKAKVGPNGVQPLDQPAAPTAAQPPGAKPAPRGTDKNGRPFSLQNGKWVYEDGTPAQ